MDFIGYIIAFCAIAGFAFYIHSLQTNHRYEIMDLKEKIERENQALYRERSDREYAYIKKKIQRIVVAELQFMYEFDEDEAVQKYNILDETARIIDFFEANTFESRKKILEDAETEIKNK